MKPNEKAARKWYSRYVRLKGCIETTWDVKYGKCFTCGKIMSFEQLQCGHFVSGRSNSLFFEPNNSHIQCPTCNTVLGGNSEIYLNKMIAVYGETEVARLQNLRHKNVKITDYEFKTLASEYRSRCERIL
jgi:hypothetical protein